MKPLVNRVLSITWLTTVYVVVVAVCNKCDLVSLTRRVLSYHLHWEHGFVIEREKANCPESLIVEVDGFEDMKNKALNSQDTSWREIYAKYL